jgi:Ca2+-binding RTX toxin-like protein
MLLSLRIFVVAALALSAIALCAFADDSSSGESDVASGSTIAVIVINGSAQNDDIRLSYTGDSNYRVTNSTGIEARSSCAQIDSTTADCLNTAPAPSITYVSGGGDDGVVFNVPSESTITVQSGGTPTARSRADHYMIAAGSPARARFSSYNGPDTLVGAANDDFLSGGNGPDRLLGRSGNDRLLGGRHSDVLVGGPGHDRIEAAYGDQDMEIRCGSGNDLAVIDRALDPAPRGCETVRMR